MLINYKEKKKNAQFSCLLPYLSFRTASPLMLVFERILKFLQPSCIFTTKSNTLPFSYSSIHLFQKKRFTFDIIHHLASLGQTKPRILHLFTTRQ